MITISILFCIGVISLLIGAIFTADKVYEKALACFSVCLISIIFIFDIFNFVNEIRDKLRTQAVEYGYAKYEVDSKGKTTFAWIVPTPKVEPTKPAPVKPEPVVVEKN